MSHKYSNGVIKVKLERVAPKGGPVPKPSAPDRNLPLGLSCDPKTIPARSRSAGARRRSCLAARPNCSSPADRHAYAKEERTLFIPQSCAAKQKWLHRGGTHVGTCMLRRNGTNAPPMTCGNGRMSDARYGSTLGRGEGSEKAKNFGRAAETMDGMHAVQPQAPRHQHDGVPLPTVRYALGLCADRNIAGIWHILGFASTHASY